MSAEAKIGLVDKVIAAGKKIESREEKKGPDNRDVD